MKRLESTGEWADRRAFLQAIEADAPSVLWTLRKLLRGHSKLLAEKKLTGSRLLSLRFRQLPDLSAQAASSGLKLGEVLEARQLVDKLVNWGCSWNLVGYTNGRLRGRWMLRVAGDTLFAWALSGGRPLPETPLAWVIDATDTRHPTGGAWISPQLEATPAIWNGTVDHQLIRSRAKRKMGHGAQLLRAIPDYHLRAFVGWQLLGEGARKAARRWSEAEGRATPPDAPTVIARMKGLTDALDLPPRPPAKLGRPRKAG